MVFLLLLDLLLQVDQSSSHRNERLATSSAHLSCHPMQNQHEVPESISCQGMSDSDSLPMHQQVNIAPIINLAPGGGTDLISQAPGVW